jgi:hypothetical protein
LSKLTVARPVRGVSFLEAVILTGGAEKIVVVTLSGRGKEEIQSFGFVCRAKVRRKWGIGSSWQQLEC